jgi:transposase
MMSVSARKAVDFTLSPGNDHDAPHGRLLMETVGKMNNLVHLLMDKAYADKETRYIAQILRYIPVTPPPSNYSYSWVYDKNLYKRRNEIERLFRLIQGFRRVFTRYDKLDIMYTGFIHLALLFVAIQ